MPLAQGIESVLYQVCWGWVCLEPVEARTNQTIVVLAMDELALPHYSAYFGDVWVTLTASNRAGLSAVSPSSSVAVPPLDVGDGVVGWGQGVGLQSLFNASFTISGFNSGAAPITLFTYCVSSQPFAVYDILPCVSEPSAPHANTVALRDLTLSQPTVSFSAYVTVTACNDYGSCSTAISTEIRLDKDPPVTRVGFEPTRSYP